ncbi:acyl-CoA thioesterase [Amycolatopsis cihanbeyliensis]|uniref:Acyl-CoA thioesterase n=1 Tax=Amycolatopsis cihanbeyliensis TaxID=1128664 RepID=A0A542DRX5_AMYCI|nr:thioesterase family protein [Amycolatopsis cihanbeyliensis]TQJ05873.1 acyl-CoA thioesterase [Amycolatopsis cihanbeyliensis]
MGNLGSDTAVEPTGQDRYRAVLSPDWAMWGPNGGYLAAIALRAAGAATTLARPASVTCSFLGTATFDPVELRVTRLRSGRRAEALRVGMFQDDRPIVEASVWTVAANLDGPERQWRDAPEVPPPAELPTMAERVAAAGGKPIPLWRNYEIRPVGEPPIGPDRPAGEPNGKAWVRFIPQAAFPEDPWLEACRAVIAMDIIGFPSVAQGFPAEELTFIAPTLDLQLTFHGATPTGDWLLIDSEGLRTGAGLAGARAQVWSPEAGMVASGGQQMIMTVPRQEGR